MTAFALLLNVAKGLRDRGDAVAFWSLNVEKAIDYAKRLHADAELRTQAAVAVGATLDEFDQRAPEILSAAHGLVPFSATRIQETVNSLRTGSPF